MGVLVAVGLECGTGLESAGGRSVVQGGEGHMGDEVSKARGDPEFVGEDAVGAVLLVLAPVQDLLLDWIPN